MVNSLISERGLGKEYDAERSAEKINDRQRGDRGDQDPQQHPDRLRNHLPMSLIIISMPFLLSVLISQRDRKSVV